MCIRDRALGAGICHYGGNLMQIYALPLLSAPVSNLLLKTSSLWTYLWGVVYGEYKLSLIHILSR